MNLAGAITGTWLLGVIVTLIIILILICFSIGFYIVYNDEELSKNTYLKNLLISVAALVGVSFFLVSIPILNVLMFIAIFSILWVIYTQITNTKVYAWIMPMIVLYTVLMLIFVVTTIMIGVQYKDFMASAKHMSSYTISLTPKTPLIPKDL